MDNMYSLKKFLYSSPPRQNDGKIANKNLIVILSIDIGCFYFHLMSVPFITTNEIAFVWIMIWLLSNLNQWRPEFRNAYMQHHGRWGNVYSSMRLASVLLRIKSTSSQRIICKSNSTSNLSTCCTACHVVKHREEGTWSKCPSLIPHPAYSVPNHYLNHCWVVVNWTFRNKLQWNFDKKSKFVIQEIVFENVIYKMAAILPRERRSSLTSTEI